jgi:membrane-associated PAP2 superfamily phosphatase
MFCPYELTRYGGDVPYVKLFERFPDDARPERRGVCFPAGHASGGFALLALSGLAATRRGRLLGIAIGLAVGPWMGIYQMLKGAHYLSHTLITLVLMWLLFLACRAALERAWRCGPDSP